MPTFKCHVCCGETERNAFISEMLEVDGRHVLMENIPARVCTHCGEAVLSRETTERIRLLVHGEGQPIRAIPMDVFVFN
jgi:YgiT-type zinc finger domain-containing protein